MVRAILHSAGKLLKRKPRLCVCEPPKEHFICKLFSFCLDTIVPRYANNLYAAIIARGKNAFSILIGGIGGENDSVSEENGGGTFACICG